MRILILLLILALLVGCAPQAPEKFNVSMFNASHEDVFNPDTNRTLDTISFIIQNNEPFDLDCSVILTLDNTTTSGSKTGKVGVLQPDQQKHVSLGFEMPSGKTELQIVPDCQMS